MYEYINKISNKIYDFMLAVNCSFDYTILTHRNNIGRCHNYTYAYIFSKNITDDFNYFKYYTFDDANKIRILLFEKIDDPHEGDIVVYMKDGVEQHYGIYINQITIESKWGSFPQILRHFSENVPICYGNDILYYTLKDKTLSKRFNFEFRYEDINSFNRI